MTLLKPVEVDEKLNNQDMMKMEKFMQLVKETDAFLKKHGDREPSGIICVAAGNGMSNNPYVKFVAEYIFDSDLHIGGVFLGLGKTSRVRLFFNCKEKDFSAETKKEINRLLTWHFLGSDYFGDCEAWRDDIEFFRNNPNYFSGALNKYFKTLESIQYFSSDKSIFNDEDTLNTSRILGMPNIGVLYMIFWNLFLTAIDDEIYNSQLADVIDLAYMFKFDEPMIRDWCHAVEYVLRGNKLGKDCDLEVETVEGNFFFKSDSLQDFFEF